jgi:hypothetical protein
LIEDLQNLPIGQLECSKRRGAAFIAKGNCRLNRCEERQRSFIVPRADDANEVVRLSGEGNS